VKISLSLIKVGLGLCVSLLYGQAWSAAYFSAAVTAVEVEDSAIKVGNEQ